MSAHVSTLFRYKLIPNCDKCANTAILFHTNGAFVYLLVDVGSQSSAKEKRKKEKLKKK